MKKQLPFTKQQIETISKTYPTPFYLYDEKAIRENARAFCHAFDWVEGGFKNYFAVKACPNPYIMHMLKEEGLGADCSSLAELVLAENIGLKGEEIMFSSNNTPAEEYQKAKTLGAIINVDDLSHIPFLEKHAGIPETISFRYNPGSLRKHKGNFIIGNPEEAKYGLTKEQLFEAYKIMRDKGVKKFGLHTMVVSNELDEHAIIETAEITFTLAKEISQKLHIRFSFIDLGGGIGIPYESKQQAVNVKFISQEIKKLYQEKIVKNHLDPIRIVMECGRFMIGPYGYLVTKVLHKKRTYKQFLGVDASMANLMRPGMLGSYHHVTVLGKETKPKTETYDIVGSLCINYDKFAVDRKLPNVTVGDNIVLHDTGAYGYGVGFNFNGKLRSAELLLQDDGKVKRIRRAETIDDYFATLDFSDFKKGAV